MPRIRTIKPETWDDATLGSLPRDARLLFIACWNFADDEGRILWSAAYLKAKIFPFDDDLSAKDVQILMDSLEEVGRIRSYAVEKPVPQVYAVIPHFRRHQYIQRPQKSLLPAPSEGVIDDDVAVGDDSDTPHGEVSEDYRPERKGKEEKNLLPPEEEAADLPPKLKIVPPDPMEHFTEFYAAYPRRRDRLAAEKAWKAAVKRKVDPQRMIAAAESYAKSQRGVEATYIKLPATWLNKGAYDNEPEVSKTFVDGYGNVVSRSADPWGRHG